MKIALLQSELIWQNPTANRNHFSDVINSINDSVDMIVLPEMFTTGFTMSPDEIFETMDGETVSWMKNMSAQKNAAIIGSVVIKDNDYFYNRLLFVTPAGKIHHYDKRHLFTLAGEEKVFAPGNSKLIVEYKGWKICPLVCYDLRFPVFSRNTEEYDLLIYVANWPKARINAWDILLKARAIENVCYSIGVNRIGTDNNNHDYVGHSQANDFFGNNLLQPTEQAGIFIVDLDKDELIETRTKFAFLNDRDYFKVLD